MKEDNSGTPGKQVVTEQRLNELLVDLQSRPIIKTILERLDRELPASLYYHSATHTHDVLREVLLFSLTEDLCPEQIEMLAIAAAYHDAGFLRRSQNNEEIGADLARQAMSQTGGFSEAQIECVTTMITDTKLVTEGQTPRQNATNELSRYLLDADLSNLGRDDFFQKGELQRREIGLDKETFLRRTYELIANHRWLTDAARTLRQTKQQENLLELRKLLGRLEAADEHVRSIGLSLERLGFLAKLPLLLNSSLDTQRIVNVAIENLRNRIGAEAATLFLCISGSDQLQFFALEGGDEQRLAGQVMPRGRGIVGWVIDKRESVIVADAPKDPRFFGEVDNEGGFRTRDLICVPLIARGERTVGAVQVLNKLGPTPFNEEDMLFVEQFSNQVAIALDNARLYEELHEKTAALETLDQRKNEMMSVISHEFRTPLNVIQTSSELIASGMLKDEKTEREMGETLSRGVDRLTKIVSEIRNLSLITKQELATQHEKLDAADLARSAFESFADGLRTRKLETKLEIKKTVGAVEGDRMLLILALKNLISNAIRYTPDGGKVTVEVRRSMGMVEFSIKDTGVGIERSQVAVIFEKFYEIRPALEHTSGDLEFNSGGLGLGLATVQSILTAHRTRVVVESTPGVGSTFRFALPAAL